MLVKFVKVVLMAFGAWCAAGLTTLFVLYAPWRKPQ